MGKSDKQEAQKVAGETQQINRENLSQGQRETAERLGTITGRSDRERQQLNDIYTGFTGSSRDNYRVSRDGGSVSSSGGGGGGGGGGGRDGKEDYVGVWEELMNSVGGYDKARLANITGISGKLAGAEGNYGISKDAMNALQEFAGRGGVTDNDRSAINRDTLLEFEKTGGYSDKDLANIRSRSNSAVPAYYQNLQDDMGRRRGVNNFGPGFDRAGFKLMREGAQQQANTARDTEIGISDAVRSGRSDASKFLSTQGLGLADLTSRNQLQGYGAAGNMNISRNKAIEEAIASSAGIDMNLQSSINQSRLGASTSKAQDARARQQIAAASAAAAAARSDANSRFAMQMEQEDRMFGASGLSDTYSRRPEELIYNQGLLRDYRNDMVGSTNQDVRNRIDIGYMPGLGSDIMSGVNIAGGIAGIAGGGLGGLVDPGRFGGRGQAPKYGRNSPSFY